MIKIEIENRVAKENEYITMTLAAIVVRLNILKKSLDHLTGSPINYNDINFVSLKAVTRKIINRIENRNDNEDLYSVANYNTTITNYLASPNQLSSINLSGIYDLLNSLLINNSSELEKLLICSPEELYNLNNQLLNDNGIILENEKFILKQAFNYNDFVEISNEIKSFFRQNNFVKYCPYCNYNEVEYMESNPGQIANSHHLDHFFDKATFPLLSYSMYNLIPSDYNCNSTNKGSIEFSNDFHLNPYIEGFGNSMNFIPIQLGSKVKVESIDIRINVPYGSRKYNQLLGNNHFINETDENGNINVFSLFTRYKNKTNKAEKILRTLRSTDKGLKSIEKIIRLLNPNLEEKKEIYIKWYNDNIDSPFKYKNFNKEAYSKFNRDVHDYYYSISGSIANGYILELINENNS